MDRYSHGFKEAKVQRVLANLKMQTEVLNCGDKIGFVKVAGSKQSLFLHSVNVFWKATAEYHQK